MGFLNFKIVNRASKDLGTYQVPDSTTLGDLKAEFHRRYPKYYPERQYFTIENQGGRVALKDDGLKLSSDLKQNGVLTFKDLGPQIAWTTVFLVEYLGPMLIHAAFYFFPALFYSQPAPPKTFVQQLCFGLVIIHYMKREYETLFVHRFGNGTMPLFNIFKNSGHYWVTGGLFIAYFLYHPLYTNTVSDSTAVALAVAMVLAEFGNFHAHVVLRNLRPQGSKIRGVPRGGLFELCTCANYTFEVLAWFFFSVLSSCLTSYLFLAFSGGQMALWAIKKHKAIEKSQRVAKYCIIPYIL